MLSCHTPMKHTGFTLIELLVVISIVSLLASIMLAAFTAARDNADDAYRVQSIKELQKAFYSVRDDLGYYPAPPPSERGANGLTCLDATQPCVLTYTGFHPDGSYGDITYTFPPSPYINNALTNYIKIQKQFAPISGSYPGPLYGCYNYPSPTTPPYQCKGDAVIYFPIHQFPTTNCGGGRLTGDLMGDRTDSRPPDGTFYCVFYLNK